MYEVDAVKNRGSELRPTPTDYTTSRNALLDTHWNTPLTFFHETPGVLIPDTIDTNQTLGSTLSENGFQTYKDFREALISTDSNTKATARKVAANLHKMFPYPKKLLEDNPDLLNWVPWEAVIAYGKKLDAVQDSTDTHAHIDDVVAGTTYTSALRDIYGNKGYIPERSSIVLERQNANALLQGPQEAIANSVDALSSREQIGQFGWGVKQMFNLLQTPEARLKVFTKQAQGDVLRQEARKGYRDQIYLKFSNPSPEDKQHFEEIDHGTSIEVTGIDFDNELQTELIDKIKQRFKFVPDARIFVNGMIINEQHDIRAIGRNGQIEPAGDIHIDIDAHHIRILDTGRGMNKKNLFRMFLPGLGSNEYKVLSDSEIEEHVQKNGEVLLTKEEKPQIVFTRNREAVYTLDIPENRLNDTRHTLCLELGRSLQVSEGREGFEMNSQFVLGIQTLLDKVLSSETIDIGDKIELMNSLILALDTLNGQEIRDQENETSRTIHTIKKHIREKAKPVITNLIKSGKRLLPNYKQYSKVMDADIFVDPYILAGYDKLPHILAEIGYLQLTQDDGIYSPDQWKIFTGPVTHGMQAQDLNNEIQSGQGLRFLQAQHERVLPVVIDDDSRVAMIDENMWNALQQEQDPTKKAILQEAVQAIINKYVQTSYEIGDPRHVYIQSSKNEKNTERAFRTVSEFEPWEEQKLNDVRPNTVWLQGQHIHCLKSDGSLYILDKNTGELIDIKNLPIKYTTHTNSDIYPDSEGFWIKHGGEVVHFDNDYIVNSYYKNNSLQHLAQTDSLTSQGNILYTCPIFDWSGLIQQVKIFESREKDTLLYEAEPTSFDTTPTSPYKFKGNTLALAYHDKVEFIDLDTGNIQSTQPGTIENTTEGVQGQRFFQYNGDMYFLAVKENIAVELNEEEEEEEYTYLEPTARLYKLAVEDNHIAAKEIMSENISDSYCFSSQINEETGELMLIKDYTVTPYKILDQGVQKLPEFNMQENTEEIIGQLQTIFKTLPIYSKMDLYEDDGTMKKLRGLLSVVSPSDRQRRLENFATLLQSSSFINTFNRIYDELQEDPDRIKASIAADRLTDLLLYVSDLTPEEVTQEKLWILACNDEPFSLLHLPKEQMVQLEALVQQEDTFEKKCMIIEIVHSFKKHGSPSDLEHVFQQLQRIQSVATYEQALLQFYKTKFNIHAIREAIVHPEKLDELDPLRTWILFLKEKADFLPSRDDSEDISSYTPILPANTPLELIAYLRKLEGLQTIEEMNKRIIDAGGVEAIMSTVNLTYYKEELKKAIHGQAVGAGVEKRELIQNALYACRKNYTEESAITVDYYFRNNGREYVEEISDNGTGIQDLPVFWVPGLSDKDSKEGLGFFGSGFNKVYKQLSHEGDSLEVDTIVQTSHGYKRTIMRYKPVLEGSNVIGMILSEVKAKEMENGQTGTHIRLVKTTEGRLPELEAMIGKNTYVTTAGLATHPLLTDKPVPIYFMDKEENKKEIELQAEKLTSYYIDDKNNTMTFVRTPQLKAFMSSGGLHMGYIEGTNPPYLALVPEPLKQFIASEHISAVLSSQIPLIKDRSRIANEADYISQIQCAYVGEALQQLAFKVLADPEFKMPEIFPEDMYSNPNYLDNYSSEVSREARRIATLIMRNVLLSTEDVAWLTESDDNNRLFYVAAAIEKTNQNGKKDSILRRFQKVQQETGNEYAGTIMKKHLNLNTEETEVDEDAASIIEHSKIISTSIKTSKDYLMSITQEMVGGQLPEGVRRLGDMDIPDKDYMGHFYRTIGFEEVYIVSAEKMSSKGVFSRASKKIFLNENLFRHANSNDQESIRERWETIIHENSHLFEALSQDQKEGMLDSEEQIDPQITHQQNGPFAHFYRLGAYAAANFINLN